MGLKHAFWLSLYLFIGSKAIGQDKLTIENLFYCNSTSNISKLWILNQNNAIGARRESNSDPFIKDIILLNREGLIKDSLSFTSIFESNSYFLQNIQNLFVIDSNSFYVVVGRVFVKLGIESEQFVVSDMGKISNKKKFDKLIYEFDPLLAYHYIARYDSLLIGYERENVKANKKKIKNPSGKDWENFPLFWILEFDQNNGPEKKILINDIEPIKTDNLFLDYKDWDNAWSKTAVFSQYFTFNNSTFFFIVNRANKCFTYDILEQKVGSFDFPNISSGESCFYYYDHITQKNYVVKKTTSESFEIFYLTDDFKKIKFLRTSDTQPHAIINNQIHTVSENSENGNKYFCHYLIPLFENTESLKILDEVRVKDQ